MTKTGKNEFRCFCQFWREKTISLFSSVLAEKGDFTVFVHFNEKEWFQCFSPFCRKKVILLFLSIFEKKVDFNFRGDTFQPYGLEARRASPNIWLKPIWRGKIRVEYYQAKNRVVQNKTGLIFRRVIFLLIRYVTNNGLVNTPHGLAPTV